MSKEIVELMRKQLEQQQAQLQLQKEQIDQHGSAIVQTLQMLAKSHEKPVVETEKLVAETSQSSHAVPKFSEFDSSLELWSDYYLRFQTFVKAHSVPENRIATIFLTNQSVATPTNYCKI